jgi:hypothetical protein
MRDRVTLLAIADRMSGAPPVAASMTGRMPAEVVDARRSPKDRGGQRSPVAPARSSAG